MEPIEIEVMSLHYTGTLSVVPVKEDNSVFAVYINGEPLGTAHPVKVRAEVRWYSHQIKDKELLNQIGEWIEFHFPLTEDSFKNVYTFNIPFWMKLQFWRAKPKNFSFVLDTNP